MIPKIKKSLQLDDIMDTVVCPAREEGLNQVFLGEKRWYAIKIRKDRIPHLKYIAIYEKKPIKAIRYLGEIKEIKPYEDTEKYEIILKRKPKKIKPIRRSKINSNLALQNRQYTNKNKLEGAEWLDDIFGKNLK